MKTVFIKTWVKQEGAELCQAQPAKHKLFGSNGAIFFVLIVDGCIVELLNCWGVGFKSSSLQVFRLSSVQVFKCLSVQALHCWIV